MGECAVANCSRPITHLKMCSMHYQRYRRWGDPLKGRTPNGESMEYLNKQLENPDPFNCMIWPYRRDANGYARVSVNSLDTLVTRYVCEKFYGPPSPDKNNAAHSCGKGSSGCYNPWHLRWDSYAGNEADKLLHGTHNRGEQSGVHKLTENEVIAIRALAKPLGHKAVAEMFNISTAQVSRVRNKVDWWWLE